MAVKPILFNSEMTKAIIDGRKTQTRRLVKGLPLYEPYFEVVDGVPMFCDDNGDWYPATCFSRIQPGDILWVRETWRSVRYVRPARAVPVDFKETGFEYRADGIARSDGKPEQWRPSIHMPREAARIFLRAENVRIERLQDMTEEDAFAEGYDDSWPWCYHKVFENYPDSPIPCVASDGRDCPADRPCDHSIPELFGREIW